MLKFRQSTGSNITNNGRHFHDDDDDDDEDEDEDDDDGGARTPY